MFKQIQDILDTAIKAVDTRLKNKYIVNLLIKNICNQYEK